MTTIIHLHIHTRAGANRPDPPDPDDALHLHPCSPARARAALRGFAAFAHLPQVEQVALWRNCAETLRAARHPALQQRRTGGDAA